MDENKNDISKKLNHEDLEDTPGGQDNGNEVVSGGISDDIQSLLDSIHHEEDTQEAFDGSDQAESNLEDEYDETDEYDEYADQRYVDDREAIARERESKALQDARRKARVKKAKAQAIKRKKRRKRIRNLVILAVGIVIGISAAYLVMVNLNVFPGSTGAAAVNIKSMDQRIYIEDSEITTLAYENYWNFISMSYIVVGSDRENCQLYKISSEVARNDYDTECFGIGDDGLMDYNDSKYSYKVGVDVSKFQGNVEWSRVKAYGIDFAMLRIGYRGYGEGQLALDVTYEQNATALDDTGMPYGVYFYTQAINYDEGVEEANYVLDNLGNHHVTYPIVIDTEYMDNVEARANDISNEDRTQAVIGFCETIKAAGYTPMIYANRNWYAANLDMSLLGDYKLWLAQYANAPDFPYLYDVWQYSSSGNLPGITGKADMNIWITAK